jgi:predicted transcriptional regulator
MTKSQILSSIEKLPEELTVDQVIEHLIFMHKVDRGRADSASGKIYTKEEAKKKLEKWLK